ncbi:MAG: sigma-70 family RNA polymerase sigma factor, partial [Bacteroidia bacterium]|nr:sigma-70 family RNA polymerase sigma factor [Bacteroidia bacterium]
MHTPHPNELVTHIFRHEAGKMVAVLTKLFGFDRLEVAQDLVQDTFVMAYESWKLKGIPQNPTGWLYTVAKNKALDYVRRQQNFQKIAKELKSALPLEYNISAEIEKAFQSITDSQLQMFFAVCHPAIPPEAQVALALQTLGGFSVEEIARAFLSNRENIKKRLQRARDKIRHEQIRLEFPNTAQLGSRLQSVLQCIYLLFNEGYHSRSQETVLRKDLCLEAMRLGLLLTQFPPTNRPEVNALMALMCFHASRFESRL